MRFTGVLLVVLNLTDRTATSHVESAMDVVPERYKMVPEAVRAPVIPDWFVKPRVSPGCGLVRVMRNPATPPPREFRVKSGLIELGVIPKVLVEPRSKVGRKEISTVELVDNPVLLKLFPVRSVTPAERLKLSAPLAMAGTDRLKT